MTRLRLAGAFLALIAAGCGQTPPSPLGSAVAASVAPTSAPPTPVEMCADGAPPPEAPTYAFFHCAGAPPGTEPRPVPRDADAADPVGRLEAALVGLVGGPTEAERAAGYTSFFSEETALAVLGVAIQDDGTAIVDFGDIRFLNNASTSAGAAALVSQLNATVFQVEEVAAVIYRIEGSCDVFWEWLQSICMVVPRP